MGFVTSKLIKDYLSVQMYFLESLMCLEFKTSFIILVADTIFVKHKCTVHLVAIPLVRDVLL